MENKTIKLIRIGHLGTFNGIRLIACLICLLGFGASLLNSDDSLGYDLLLFVITLMIFFYNIKVMSMYNLAELIISKNEGIEIVHRDMLLKEDRIKLSWSEIEHVHDLTLFNLRGLKLELKNKKHIDLILEHKTRNIHIGEYSQLLVFDSWEDEEFLKSVSNESWKNFSQRLGKLIFTWKS